MRLFGQDYINQWHQFWSVTQDKPQTGGLMNASVAKLERRNQLKTLQLLCQPFSPCRGCRSFGCHKDKDGLSIQDRHIEIIDAYATLTLWFVVAILQINSPLSQALIDWVSEYQFLNTPFWCIKHNVMSILKFLKWYDINEWLIYPLKCWTILKQWFILRWPCFRFFPSLSQIFIYICFLIFILQRKYSYNFQ